MSASNMKIQARIVLFWKFYKCICSKMLFWVIIGMSFCTFGAKVVISSFRSQNVFRTEIGDEHKLLALSQNITGHDNTIKILKH